MIHVGQELAHSKENIEMDVWAYRRDKIKHEDIQDKVGVSSVVNKMLEVMMRWFRDVKRRCTYVPMRSPSEKM